MRKILGILVLALSMALTLGAQETRVAEPTSSTFGLSSSDEAFVKKMRHRMDSIRKHRPTVALVLSGGGAKGAATIGALEYLKKYDFPIDVVAGTSIGGLIGGLYALGYTPASIDTMVRNMDWDMALSDKVDKSYVPYSRIRYKEKYLLSIPFYYRQDDYRRFITGDASLSDGLSRKFDLGATQNVKNNLMGSLPSGFVYGQNVNQVFTSRSVGYSDSLDFAKLPIPFVCVATDMVSSKAKIWHSGSINTALRSTMSIPGLFVPVRTEGMILVDGGMRNNYPANLVKSMGADIIIGIDLSGANPSAEKIQNLGDILMQSMDLFSNDAREYSLPLFDVSIHPDLTGYNMLSFNAEAIDVMYWKGYRAAAEKTRQLDSLRAVLGKSRFSLQAAPATDIGVKAVVIEGIDIVGVPQKEADYIRSRMYIKPGSIVNKRVIEEDIAKIFGRGAYDYVNYELRGSSEPYRLRIICKRGPMHQFGLGVRMDSRDLVSILLNVGLNTNAMSGHSLDFTSRISTNPYAELRYSYNAPVFATFNARAFVRYTDSNRFLSGSGRFNISFIQGTQELFMSNMRWSAMDIKVGLQNHFYKVINVLSSADVGDYDYPADLKDYPGAFITGRVETLDNGYFPTKGVSAGFRSEILTRALYPSEPLFFGAASADFTVPVTFGRFTLIPQGSIRLLFGDDIPIQYANVMGGDLWGQYVDQQIPFVGVSNSAFRRNCLAVARLDARVRLWDNHYVSLMGNVAYDFVDFDSIVSGEMVGGAGLSYAYNSVFGPLKLQLHWSSLTQRVGAYLSIGYNF